MFQLHRCFRWFAIKEVTILKEFQSIFPLVEKNSCVRPDNFKSQKIFESSQVFQLESGMYKTLDLINQRDRGPCLDHVVYIHQQNKEITITCKSEHRVVLHAHLKTKLNQDRTEFCEPLT